MADVFSINLKLRKYENSSLLDYLSIQNSNQDFKKIGVKMGGWLNFQFQNCFHFGLGSVETGATVTLWQELIESNSEYRGGTGDFIQNPMLASDGTVSVSPRLLNVWHL